MNQNQFIWGIYCNLPNVLWWWMNIFMKIILCWLMFCLDQQRHFSVKYMTHLNVEIQSFRYSKFTIFKVSNTQNFRYSNSWYSKVPIFRVSDIQSFRYSNFKVPDIQSFRYSKLPIFKASDIQSFRYSKFPTVKSSQYSKISHVFPLNFSFTNPLVVTARDADEENSINSGMFQYDPTISSIFLVNLENLF